jgi:hypothetical protein
MGHQAKDSICSKSNKETKEGSSEKTEKPASTKASELAKNEAHAAVDEESD